MEIRLIRIWVSEWESLLFRFVEAFFPKLQFTVYGVPFIEWTAGTVITLSQNIIILSNPAYNYTLSYNSTSTVYGLQFTTGCHES